MNISNSNTSQQNANFLDYIPSKQPLEATSLHETQPSSVTGQHDRDEERS